MNFISVLQIILAAGALQGLVLFYLLFTRKSNHVANRLLSVLILLMSIQSGLIAFDTQKVFVQFPQITKISWLIPLFFGPLLYLFTRKITARHPRLYPIEIVHFLPVLVTFIYLLPYFIKTNGENVAFLSELEADRQNDFSLIRQVTLFQVLFYLVYSLKALYQYEGKIHNTFSELSQVRLTWLKKAIFLLLLIFLIAVIALTVTKWYVPVLTEMYHYYVHYLLVTILVYWLGYKAFAQPPLFASPLIPSTNTAPSAAANNPEVTVAPFNNHDFTMYGKPGITKKYAKHSLKPEDSRKFLDQLLEYMETAKPYRQHYLTIQELATQLQMPKHYLLQIIQTHLNKTFYDFINHYRVAEAQALLIDSNHKQETLLVIAQKVGFSSESTLKEVFKNQTGQTPSEYIRKFSADTHDPAAELQ